MRDKAFIAERLDYVKTLFPLVGASAFAVEVRPSPWRLDAGCPSLTRDWLAGWVGAAVEQRPGLAAAAPAYLARRLDEIEHEALAVTVQHVDLLALPPRARP